MVNLSSIPRVSGFIREQVYMIKEKFMKYAIKSFGFIYYQTD